MEHYFFTPNRRNLRVYGPEPPIFYSPPRSDYPFIIRPPHPSEEEPFSLQSELSSDFYHTPIKKKEFFKDFTLKSKEKQGLRDRECEEATKDVVYYFKEVLAFESEIEKVREELARRPDFRIIYVFNQFDINNSGQILISEMQLGLQNLGITASTDDIYMLIKRFSKDQLEKLK